MRRIGGWGVGTLLMVGAMGCESLPAAQSPENDPQQQPAAAQQQVAPPAKVTRRRAKLQLDDGSTVVGTIVGGQPGVDFVVVTDDGRTRTIPRRSITGGATLPMVDRVVLDDGTVVEGNLAKMVPGESVTIDKLDGSTQQFDWAHVRDVVTRPAAAEVPPDAQALGAAVASGVVIKTSTNAQVGPNGASLDIDRECASSPDMPRCKEHTRIAADSHGFMASYDSEDASGRTHADVSMTGAHASLERDCAANPQDERCTERFGADLGKGGLSAGYTRESVTAVKEPPSSAWNLNLNAGLDFGFGSTSGQTTTLMGLAVDATLPFLVGGKFPGKEGGHWFGVKIEPGGSFLALSMSSGSGDSAMQMAMIGWKAGGTVAVQYLHFGALDPTTLKQSGFGIALGGYAGAQGISGSTTIMGQPYSFSSTDASYGPSLAITFPKYNAGTAKYSSMNIIVMVLPTGDFTFVTASLGWSF